MAIPTVVQRGIVSVPVCPRLHEVVDTVTSCINGPAVCAGCSSLCMLIHPEDETVPDKEWFEMYIRAGEQVLLISEKDYAETKKK